MLVRLLGFILFAHLTIIAWCQEISGLVLDQSQRPISQVAISVEGSRSGATTNSEGYFRIRITSDTATLVFSHVGYQTLRRKVSSDDTELIVYLRESSIDLEQVEIVESREEERPAQNVQKIAPASAKALPSAFGDFSKVIVTLPGVSSNNELSSTYSVRGGNFEENLVYVDDIPVYRPFLANAGRQEGLSFVNPDLVNDISFYAGGWEAKYGDKLSSSLNIEYKEPSSLEGSITMGLLGGSAYLGGSSQNQRNKYLVGFRHRDSRYILNTLEVQGQYFPKYTDIQGLFTFDLTNKASNQRNKTKLNWLVSYSRNRYLTQPSSQQTEFGSVVRNFRLNTYFEGRETLDYDTYQTGFRLSHLVSNTFSTQLIGSVVRTSEREFYEVEGAYRLCDVDNDPTSNTFDKCVLIRGVGSQYGYGRNTLLATIASIESRNKWAVGERSEFEFGAGVNWQDINDELREYTFLDSADYASVNYSAFNELKLSNANAFGFVQYGALSKDSVHLFNLGVRANLWTESGQWLLSPRIQYQIRPEWTLPTRFNFSVGLYQQHPFYRELRDRDGEVNLNVKAQKSAQLIVGLDQFYTWWGRPFVFTSQIYYKRLWDLNPYEIDNLRIRYYAQNIANGYATGLDMRINGEFIPGTQSWFSLGILSTKEDISTDDRELIRRPSDQRINLGVYFEDHLPNDPTLRIYLNLNFGSGYPFGPPGDADLRNIFSGDEYYRADLGLTKEIYFASNKWLERLEARVEVLNALGADNTISYTWISDVNGTSFAIPNSLSARLFNVKLTADF